MGVTRRAGVCAGLIALLLSLSAHVALARVGATDARHPLILVSIDGFRWDYLDRGITPNLSALAAGGVHAERMLPSFPSVTFPNHYTLVTGLYPDHHGIVNNTFEDAHLPGVFRMSSKEEAWWDEATPIWVSAERQGVRAATEFWPGSEVAIHGVRPEHWEPYSAMKFADQRVDTLLGWLGEPPATRPRFATLYFDLVDTAGHLHGPDSPEVNRAIAATDASIGRLLAGLKSRGLQPNLVIVADHGMASVSTERTVVLDDIADMSAVHVVFTDAVSGIDIPPTDAAGAVRAKLLAPHDHLTCWDKTAVPARLHYGSNPRVPDVICMAEVGWLVETRESLRKRHFPLRGEHGYDNAAPEMGAVFIVNGPAFRHGVTIKPFENVDVYPLLISILGIHGEPNDGRLSDLQNALMTRTSAR